MERLFQLREHGTNIRTELIAGVTTYVTMAYILFLNPLILSATGMDKNAVFFATAVGSALVTLMMGLFVNFPVALAPGMGLNAYFAVVAAQQGGVVSWQVALGAVFVSGLILILLTVSRIRQLLVVAVPDSLKYAITVGIGLFITIIGLKLGEITNIVYLGGPSAGAVAKGTPVTLKFFEWNLTIAHFVENKVALLTLIGLVITAILAVARVTGALLIGILLTTLIGIPMGVTNTEAFFKTPWIPNFSQLYIGSLDIKGALTGGFFEIVLVFTFVALFDTFGTLIGTADKAGLLHRPDSEQKIGRAMAVDATGVSLGALLGTSTITAYIESASGIAAGGRTGLTSVTTAILFLLSVFLLGPLVAIIPDAATAPVLVIVGVMMMSAVKKIDFDELGTAIPAFLTIVMMPFTYSIANGIGAGIVFYVVLNAFRNLFTKEKVKIHWLMWTLAVLIVLRYIFITE
ncbi:NCS2 family permease [Effusibacillus pohliae]|uniref:NCS2 family permease n=1 Tax=Effusibacillus pohliae TaxID=232270 RepID=UPI0004756AE4|nr:NCS2 family permease [Effusibacillus pohliae]